MSCKLRSRLKPVEIANDEKLLRFKIVLNTMTAWNRDAKNDLVKIAVTVIYMIRNNANSSNK